MINDETIDKIPQYCMLSHSLTSKPSQQQNYHHPTLQESDRSGNCAGLAEGYPLNWVLEFHSSKDFVEFDHHWCSSKKEHHC